MSLSVFTTMAEALKDRRVTTITKYDTFCTGDEVVYHRWRIAWRGDDTGMIYTSLCGSNMVITRNSVNAICKALGFGQPYHIDVGGLWYNERPTDVYAANPLCGPLELLARGLAHPKG